MRALTEETNSKTERPREVRGDMANLVELIELLQSIDEHSPVAKINAYSIINTEKSPKTARMRIWFTTKTKREAR